MSTTNKKGRELRMKTKRGLPDMTWIPDRELWRKRGTYKGQKYNITAKEPEGVAEKIKAFEAQVDGAAAPAEDITVWEYIRGPEEEVWAIRSSTARFPL